MKSLVAILTVSAALLALPCVGRAAQKVAPDLGTGTHAAGTRPGRGPHTGGGEFRRNLHRIFPLSPAQINRMRTQFGMITGSVGGPAPGAVINATRALSLAPGTSGPVLRLGRGYVTAVRFVDSTGAPWPISSLTNGSAHAFSVVRPKLHPANLLMIDPLTPGGQSDVVITLEHKGAPIVLQLHSQVITSRSTRIDGAITYRLEGRGPLASAPSVQEAPVLMPSPKLLAVLDGVAPHGARAITTAPPMGEGTRLWRIDGDLYLRTDRYLVWPAWSSRMSQDGVRAYRLPRVPSLMLSGRNGTPISFDLINP